MSTRGCAFVTILTEFFFPLEDKIVHQLLFTTQNYFIKAFKLDSVGRYIVGTFSVHWCGTQY